MIINLIIWYKEINIWLLGYGENYFEYFIFRLNIEVF